MLRVARFLAVVLVLIEVDIIPAYHPLFHVVCPPLRDFSPDFLSVMLLWNCLI